MSALRAVRLKSARPWRCFHFSTRLRTVVFLFCVQNKMPPVLATYTCRTFDFDTAKVRNHFNTEKHFNIFYSFSCILCLSMWKNVFFVWI